MLFSCMSLFGQVRYFKDIPTELLNQLDKMGVDDSRTSSPVVATLIG